MRERGDKWAAARHNGTKEGHNKAGERRDGEREREREIALINDDGALLAARATRANSREIIR